MTTPEQMPELKPCPKCNGLGGCRWMETDYKGESIENGERCEMCDGAGHIDIYHYFNSDIKSDAMPENIYCVYVDGVGLFEDREFVDIPSTRYVRADIIEDRHFTDTQVQAKDARIEALQAKCDAYEETLKNIASGQESGCNKLEIKWAKEALSNAAKVSE